MRTKLFESPLWKSAFFVYGLVAVGFSIWGLSDYLEAEVPNIDELTVFTGTVSKVEHWRIKNRSGYKLLLELDGGEKQFNIDRCEFQLNLGEDSRRKISPYEIITVFAKKEPPSFGVFSVDDSVWQVEKNGVPVCPYERLVTGYIRSEERWNKLWAIGLILGLLSSAIGIIRTRRAA
ncbi:MAG: hypothetical protein BECKG1743D_GA0114223_100572 [Candidatus Kentron sp. G]|nr:MAG: hypothetical protein BECKG1743F_GA0114225_100552 [Candidatus Kentron sp. G]VFM96337.1 MAG: hypothetical protein BECKG1743E_GA0114224_100512 [Candidatus Kentron sp. G]VFM98336.1 MAG: hypothetical protein BECKG1743D_GA0114223_100572 [Candidatus Kentron sp. G]